MRWWLPSLILVGGAVATLAAGTQPQQLITLSPGTPPKQPVVIPPNEPATIPTVVVTPPPPPAVVKPAQGPSPKALANTLGDLRKPKPAPRPPADNQQLAAISPPQPRVVAPSPAENRAAPIMLLPPPQPAQPTLSEREVWLQRRAIRLDMMTARDLVLAGQPFDARRVLDNAEVHLRLFPSERSNQQQVSVAIRALDGGDNVTAVRAIIQVIRSPFSS